MVGATQRGRHGLGSPSVHAHLPTRVASPRVTASTSEALSTSGENVRTGIVSRGRQGGPLTQRQVLVGSTVQDCTLTLVTG